LVLGLKRLFILRLEDRETGIKIDICVNNMLGLVNSEYIRRYCLLDSRYLSLCRVLKHLHETHRPYGEQESLKMTNYSMNMMLLVFLIQAKVLPNILTGDPQGNVYYEMQYNLKSRTARNSYVDLHKLVDLPALKKKMASVEEVKTLLKPQGRSVNERVEN